MRLTRPAAASRSTVPSGRFPNGTSSYIAGTSKRGRYETPACMGEIVSRVERGVAWKSGRIGI